MTLGNSIYPSFRTSTSLEENFMNRGSGAGGSFSPALTVATLVDRFHVSEGTPAQNTLSYQVRINHQSLAESLTNLPRSQRQVLQSALPEQRWQRFRALSYETDPILFFEGMLNLGRQMAHDGDVNGAYLILDGMAELLREDFPGRPETHASLTARAQQELNGLMGRGPWQERVGYMAQSLLHEMSDPISLATMGLAGLAYHGVRLAAFSRLTSSARAGLLTRGLGAHLTATSVGFVAEVGTFFGAGRGLRHLAGVEQDWSAQGIRHELIGTTLMLSALKFTGFGSRVALGRMPMPAAGASVVGNGLRQLPYRIVPQAAMFTGIIGAAKAEEALGLREASSTGDLLVYGLSTLFHFAVAGKMLEAIPSYRRINNDLHLRMETLRRRLTERPSGNNPDLPNLQPNPFSSRLAAVTAGEGAQGLSRLFGERWRTSDRLMSENKNGENGGENGSRSEKINEALKDPELESEGFRTQEDVARADTVMADSLPPPEGTQGRPSVSDHSPTLPRAQRISIKQLMSAMEQVVPRISVTQMRDGEVLVNGRPKGLPRTLTGDEAALEESGQPSDVHLSPAEQIQHMARMEGMLPPPPKLEPGRMLGDGKYQLERALGEGGMGKVYLVTDTKLHRPAVIKVPHEGRVDAEFIQRFEQEKLIGAHLDPRWRVTIYDIIKLSNNQEVPVMEFVPGNDYSKMVGAITQRPELLATELNLDRRVKLWGEAAEAIQATHDMGIVHRDLKPDNIRITEQMRIRIMDYGIAKRVADNGHGSAESLPGRLRASKMPPSVEQLLSTGVTQAGRVPGTPGYMAPEIMAPGMFPGNNSYSGDVFALGVILYETITGRHPFAKYRPGDTGRGEPPLVPVIDQEGRTEIPFAAELQLQPNSKDRRRPPSFYEVVREDSVPENERAQFKALEEVAMKAMHPHPTQRYQSAEELRRAAFLTQFQGDLEKLRGIRQQMAEINSRLLESWDSYRPGTPITLEQWAGMTHPIQRLINLNNRFHLGGETLVRQILDLRRGEDWAEAQKIIAEVTWERLLSHGDRIDQVVSREMRQLIRENDVPLSDPHKKSGSLSALGMAEALDGSLPLGIRSKDYMTGQEIPEDFQIKIVPLIRELDAYGNELNNFQLGETLYNGSYSQMKLKISEGYYQLELSREGYAPMFKPLHVSLEDIRTGLLHGRPIPLDLDWVPQSQVPFGMRVIQQHTATIGHDFLHSGPPEEVISQPMRKFSHETYLLSGRPISHKDWSEFIEDKLANGASLSEISPFLPQKTIVTRPVLKMLGRITSRFREDHSFWNPVKIKKSETRNPGQVWKLPWPENPVDHNGDPLELDRPIEAITYQNIEAYRIWRSKRDGVSYRIATSEELESVARNSFPWTYPWGYVFDPFKAVNRLNFRVTEEGTDILPQPIGSHPMGESGDRSLFGVIDLVGNNRKFTSSRGSPDHYYIFGGSGRLDRGPAFNPSSRYEQSAKNRSDSYGSFFLALDLSPKEK